ncbi:MAG: hypothetical protein ACE5FJ_03230 [Gemmatimonadales bacterium]
MFTRSTHWLQFWTATTALAVLSTACSDSGPQTTLSNVAVSFSTGGPAGSSVAPFLASAAAQPDTLRDNAGNVLIINTAEIVLREIELRRLEVANCDVEPEPEGCEKFETGPVLIDLPLDGTTSRQFEIQIEPGTYTEVEFEIHKVSDDPADQTFVQNNPGFADISIKVTGTFNGQNFSYTSDLNVKQELALQPNLVISDTDPVTTNVTILANVSVWFDDGTGGLVDPDTANKGNANENLVRDNIRDSFEAFEDEDSDGRR